jgi:hypothetical protein
LTSKDEVTNSPEVICVALAVLKEVEEGGGGL